MLRVQDVTLPVAAFAALLAVRLSVFCPCSSLVRASRAASRHVTVAGSSRFAST